MTVGTAAGPVAIVATIRGGARPDWPPDRPVEWVMLVGVCLTVAALMAACVTVGLWSRPPKR